MWGAAGDQGRLGREPRAPNRDPPRCSAFHTGSWFSTGLHLEGRLPGQTGLGTIAPVPVLDGAVLLGFADGCPLSGEKPVALVPLPSSRWVQGPPKSGTLSQAPPQGGKASSGLCMARPLRNDHSEQFICAVFTLSGLCSSLEGTCSSDYCNSPYHTSKNNDLFLGHSKDLTRSWDHFHEVRHVLTGILFSIASTLFCPKRIQ